MITRRESYIDHICSLGFGDIREAMVFWRFGPKLNI